jgi:prenyltransferase beta subunit
MSLWSDPMHTYLGLSGLALNSMNNALLAVNPALNISERAVKHLKQLHAQWLTS